MCKFCDKKNWTETEEEKGRILGNTIIKNDENRLEIVRKQSGAGHLLRLWGEVSFSEIPVRYCPFCGTSLATGRKGWRK